MWNGSNMIQIHSHSESHTSVSKWWAAVLQAVFQGSIIILNMGFLHFLGVMVISRNGKRGEKVVPPFTNLKPRVPCITSAHHSLAKTQPQSQGSLGKTVWLGTQEKEDTDLVTDILVKVSLLMLQ